MKTIKLAFAMLGIAFFLSGCLPTEDVDFVGKPDEARQALVGHWQGDGAEDGGEEYLDSEDYWKTVRYENGTYELEYLSLYPEESSYEIILERGTWKLDGDIYTENSKDNGLVTYRVSTIKKNEFSYDFVDAPSDDGVITEERTSESFTLRKPPPDYVEYEDSSSEESVDEEKS